MKSHEKISLAVGLAIPVLMILFVAGSIYLPKLFVTPPQYDFVYTFWSAYNKPVVIEGTQAEKIVAEPDDYTDFSNYNEYFVYDVEKETSTKISPKEFFKLELTSGFESPDGFEVVRGGNGGMFGGGNYDKWFIKGHGVSYKLNVYFDYNYYSYYDFRFVGWIIK